MSHQLEPPPRLYPPMYFALSIILMVGLHYAVPVSRWLAWPWRALGGVPIAAGVLVGITAIVEFRRRGTTIIPFEQSSALITDGSFRYSRNPIYLSMVLILVGIWVLLGSLSPLLIVPAFVWVISTQFIPREERDLERQFGATYQEYKSRVRRWL